MFDRYGPRVPAVVISPWCPQNLIEHRQLEHSFIPATIEQLFGLGPLTNRDAGVVGLQTLATLATPRNVTTPIPDAHAAAEPGGPVPGTPAGSSGTAVNSTVGSSLRRGDAGDFRRVRLRGGAAGGAGGIAIALESQ